MRNRSIEIFQEPWVQLPFLIISLILVIIAESGSSTYNLKTVRDVYLIKIDMRNVNVTQLIPDQSFSEKIYSNVTKGLTFKDTDLPEFYTVGPRHICKHFSSGMYQVNATDGRRSKPSTCVKRSYFFDPGRIMAEDIWSGNGVLSEALESSWDVYSPDEIPSFQNVPQTIFLELIFALPIAALFSIALNILLCITYFFVQRYTTDINLGFKSLIVSWFVTLSGFGLCLSTAVIGHEMYSHTVDGYREVYYKFGVSASLGNRAYYILMFMASALLALSLIMLSYLIIYKWFTTYFHDLDDPQNQETGQIIIQPFYSENHAFANAEMNKPVSSKKVEGSPRSITKTHSQNFE